MQKKMLCMALLAAAACANAEEATWTFKYQGFTDTKTGVFMPDVMLQGYFTGSDLDGNGIIVQNELTRFGTEGDSFIDTIGTGCAQDWSPYLRCTLNSFSYKLTGELHYSTDRWGNDEFMSGWYAYIRSGDYFVGGGFTPVSSFEQRYDWSGQTRFSITPPPVPEPAAMLTLPAGIAVLLLARRRRKVSL